MSIICNLLRVSNTELQSYLADSELLQKRAYPDEVDAPDDPNHIDLEKAWDGIYFCLTGFCAAKSDEATSPQGWVIVGPGIIDKDQDLGYGYAMYADSDQVKQMAAYLANISDAEMSAGFDAEKMNAADLYPEIWDEGAEALYYLLHFFHPMKDFYLKAAANHEAVITYFN